MPEYSHNRIEFLFALHNHRLCENINKNIGKHGFLAVNLEQHLRYGVDHQFIKLFKQ